MDRKALLYEQKVHGEPIVLVPGRLSVWLSWIPFAERLSKERRVLRVQLRSVELAEAGEPCPADSTTQSKPVPRTVKRRKETRELAVWLPA